MIHYIEYDPATREGREIDPFKSPDLVAVVRCRDCKYAMAYTKAAYCEYMNHVVEINGFCAWGEKRGE